MNYWAGLNPSADQDAIRCGADALINAVMSSQMGAHLSLRIEGARSTNCDQVEDEGERPGCAPGDTDDVR
jgi:hypothetical protein